LFKNRKNFFILTRYFFVIPLALLITIMPGKHSRADIYRYTDSAGVLHFTNVPTSSRYQICIKTEHSGHSGTCSKNRYDDIITNASEKHGISFSLLKAVINVESDFNPNAVSKAWAVGLMQIMPQNIKSLCIRDPFNPGDNIMGGALYLKKLLKRYDGHLQMALAAYNAGPTIVDRYRAVPPVKETEDYVNKVITCYNNYKRNSY
jgi:soluble lytic murein transglycosylase-like protein